MRQKFAVGLGLLLGMGFSALPAKAAGEFETSGDITYEVSQEGKTQVTGWITLTNKLSTVYVTSYRLNFEGTGPENLRAWDGEGELRQERKEKEGETEVLLYFNEKVVGKGKSLRFKLEYELPEAVIKNGKVWEITLPKLGEVGKEEKIEVRLKVPAGFGEAVNIYPVPKSEKRVEGWQEYEFNFRDLLATGIAASFGEFQLFDFELTYHLVNEQKRGAIVEVALPPDTGRQRVAYKSITPLPAVVETDEDGNWIGRFVVPGETNLEVKARGTAEIYAGNRRDWYLPEPASWEDYLAPSVYWQSDDRSLRELAAQLGGVRQTYKFVVDTLSYDYGRIREGVDRLGGKQALASPETAICTEFADLFVSLSRAGGVPAREVEGYAYTTNSQLQPLSLVADVLHAWAEYWDGQKKQWVPVDPTWEKTTGGVDYFNNFDLNHFAFVIHGEDPVQPAPAGSYKLAGQPQKDVVVEFGKERVGEKEELWPTVEILRSLKYPRKVEIKLTVTNPGGQAWYRVPVKLTVAGAQVEGVTEGEMGQLPPFGKYEKVWVAKQPWWQGLPPAAVTAEVVVGEKRVKEEIPEGELWGRWLLPYVVLGTGAGAVLAGGVGGWWWIRKRRNAREVNRGT